MQANSCVPELQTAWFLVDKTDENLVVNFTCTGCKAWDIFIWNEDDIPECVDNAAQS